MAECLEDTESPRYISENSRQNEKCPSDCIDCDTNHSEHILYVNDKFETEFKIYSISEIKSCRFHISENFVSFKEGWNEALEKSSFVKFEPIGLSLYYINNNEGAKSLFEFLNRRLWLEKFFPIIIEQ